MRLRAEFPPIFMAKVSAICGNTLNRLLRPAHLGVPSDVRCFWRSSVEGLRRRHPVGDGHGARFQRGLPATKPSCPPGAPGVQAAGDQVQRLQRGPGPRAALHRTRPSSPRRSSTWCAGHAPAASLCGARAAVAQIPHDRRAHVSRQQEPFSPVALAHDRDLAAAPVDVVQPDTGDLAGAHPQPGPAAGPRSPADRSRCAGRVRPAAGAAAPAPDPSAGRSAASPRPTAPPSPASRRARAREPSPRVASRRPGREKTRRMT